jgi:lipoprotein NlpI
MQLVVEFQPNNYMALYHAGMSWYAVGNPQIARRHLVEFLRQYDVQDGWRSNALEILDRMRKDGAQ